jgi:GTP-binding protein
MKPVVAIVGKPNVGKSTFFNRITGKRLSIVENTPGVTRDRLYADAEWCGREFTLVDTGGLELKSEDEMWQNIRLQAEAAVATADLILFIVDAKTGPLLDDERVATYLKRSGKPALLVVNKIDNNEQHLAYDFYSLGMGDPFAISAEQGKGLTELLDAIIEHLPCDESTPEEESAIKIAVVGKPNAGKSSLVNKLLGYPRVIVSDIAGTTRDAIDTELEYDGQKFILIDTAGIRKKKNITDTLESYSVMRALGAIRRADVVLIVVDAFDGISEQDVRIAGYAHEQGKPSLIIMNKWDLVEKDSSTVNKFNRKLAEDLKFMEYFVPLYISAKTGQRVGNVLENVKKVFANANRRITTGLLNDVLGEAVSVNPPPARNGRQLKILFMSQVAAPPPAFAIFVNDPTLVHFSYERYLENSIRKSFDFSGTPIKLFFRERKRDDA